MEFKHPKYYKELRKRNTEAVAKLGKSHASLKSDQAISLRAHDGECERAPDPGLKQRDSTGGVPGEADISVTGHKRQASSAKPQATSLQKISDKPQAPSSKPQA